MKAYVVVTTINVPHLLKEYADNFEKFGHKNEVGFIVIGDLKTPKEAKNVCDELQSRGFDATYMDVEAQREWLKRFPELDKIIPYNSDNRRNIGFLVALEKGAEIVLSIDDDNFVKPDEDWYGYHSIVGKEVELETVESSDGWFNICTLLKTIPERTIYPRGYPYSKRWKQTEIKKYKSKNRIVLNLGLWDGEPDVDAVTRLHKPVKVQSDSSKKIMLSKGTNSPINTQNTAIHRDAMPAYYYIPMGVTIHGNKIDRYGDIWSGLFVKKVIDHMGDTVAVGGPTVIHNRNPHNLLKDLKEELSGMILTEKLVSILESIRLSSSNYLDSYRELSDKLQEAVKNDNEIDEETKNYFYHIVKGMKTWSDVCEKIMKTNA